MQQSFQPAPPQQQTPNQAQTLLPPQSLMEKIKTHKTSIILGSFACILLTGLGAYAFSPIRNTLVAPATIELPTAAAPTKPPKVSPTTRPVPSITPAPTIPSSAWKLYNNSTYGYSLRYPPDWKVTNIGVLEPKIPSYVVLNNPTASASARNITISVSTRTYTEQLALGASGSATTVGGIAGTKQSFQDSDGNTSTVITLPRTTNLLVLRAKTAYLPIFNQILSTIQTTK
jgi:hypothetical protein